MSRLSRSRNGPLDPPLAVRNSGENGEMCLLPADMSEKPTRNRTDDLCITRVFPCVVRGFKARTSFMFAGLLKAVIVGC